MWICYFPAELKSIMTLHMQRQHCCRYKAAVVDNIIQDPSLRWAVVYLYATVTSRGDLSVQDVPHIKSAFTFCFCFSLGTFVSSEPERILILERRWRALQPQHYVILWLVVQLNAFLPTRPAARSHQSFLATPASRLPESHLSGRHIAGLIPHRWAGGEERRENRTSSTTLPRS